MKFKKTTSIFLSAVMAAASLFCVSATTVSDTDVVEKNSVAVSAAPAKPEKPEKASETAEKETDTKQSSEEKATEAETKLETTLPSSEPQKTAPPVKKKKEKAKTGEAQTRIVEYKYYIATEKKLAAFQVSIDFADTVTGVQSASYYNGETVSTDNGSAAPNVCDNFGQMNGNVFRFNATYKNDVFDFSTPKPLVTLMLEVTDNFGIGDVTPHIEEIYNVENVKSKNIPFRYEETLDGEVVRKGQSSQSEHVYLIKYNYSVGNSLRESNVVYTTAETNALSVAQSQSPSLRAPDYEYSFSNSDITQGENYELTVNIRREKKKFEVYVDGEPFTDENHPDGQFEYKNKATVTTDEVSSFSISDGKVVKIGTSFTFYVIGNTEVETNVVNEGAQASTYAILDDVDYSLDTSRLTLELLVTGNIPNATFKKLGVAYSSVPLTDLDKVKADILQVNTVKKTGRGSNGTLVYNSGVVEANVSGQYQVIYEPYFNNPKNYENLTLYMYAFIVDSEDNVTLSDSCITKNIGILLR